MPRMMAGIPVRIRHPNEATPRIKLTMALPLVLLGSKGAVAGDTSAMSGIVRLRPQSGHTVEPPAALSEAWSCWPHSQENWIMEDLVGAAPFGDPRENRPILTP